MTDVDARRIELERSEARRKAFEEVLERLETMKGNYMYQKAFKVVKAAVRSMIVNPRVTG